MALLLISIPVCAAGQVTLIDSSTHNGSFEDGVLAPWNANASVLQDPGFASDGAWYASAQSSGVLPVLANHNLLPDLDAGLEFFLSFDARMGIPGLSLVSPSMSARTPGGAPVNAIVTPIATPPITSSAWQTQEYQLEMSEAWNSVGVTLQFSFSNDQPLGGVTHTAYLDNVVLTQIPEPTTVSFLFLTLPVILGIRGRRITQ